MAFSIPTLTTERLLLRASCAADLAPFTAMWQEPDFYRHLTGQPRTGEECWRQLLQHMGCWVMLGYGYWSVEERESGEFIGCVGFADWQRDMTPSLRGYPEIGWVLAPRSHGRGYATEAARAALAWADAQLAERRTVCIIAPENAASRTVASKLGYREIGESVYKGNANVVLERWAGKL